VQGAGIISAAFFALSSITPSGVLFTIFVLAKTPASA
jgi:hypothetical protein